MDLSLESCHITYDMSHVPSLHHPIQIMQRYITAYSTFQKPALVFVGTNVTTELCGDQWGGNLRLMVLRYHLRPETQLSCDVEPLFVGLIVEFMSLLNFGG